MTEAQRLNPVQMGPPLGSYSQISLHKTSGQAHFAGQVATDADGNFVGEGDISLQTEQIFANIAAGLKSIGAQWSSVIKLTTYLVRQEDFPAFVTTLRSLMSAYYPSGEFPSHTLVYVSALTSSQYLLEVEATVAYESKD